MPVGTRVLADGPFGVFTAAARRGEKLLLIAGGIGVTPVRALLEELRGDVVGGGVLSTPGFPAATVPAARPAAPAAA